MIISYLKNVGVCIYNIKVDNFFIYNFIYLWVKTLLVSFNKKIFFSIRKLIFTRANAHILYNYYFQLVCTRDLSLP